MSKYFLVALTNQANGTADDEFNQWYDGTHVPQVRAAVSAITGVTRYRATDAQPSPDGSVGHRFLTVYDIDTDDPAAALGSLGQGVATGAIETGSVLDVSSNPPVLALYEEL